MIGGKKSRSAVNREPRVFNTRGVGGVTDGSRRNMVGRKDVFFIGKGRTYYTYDKTKYQWLKSGS